MENDVTAVVLTYNEELNIESCLRSAKDFCRIKVVDSGSDDRTVEICKEFTNDIYQHAYQNHASQWQWALDNVPIETEWVFALDADFYVTEQLKGEINCKLNVLPKTVNGIYVRHLYTFGGGRIRFGGTKSYWLRLVRNGHARVDRSDLVDFRFLVDGGTQKWKSPVIESNVHDEDISAWLRKQDKFSLRLAVEEELRRNKQLGWEIKPKLFGNSDERFMWLRDKWLALPLFVRPVFYFIYRYVLMLGFADGRAGFLYHFLQGFWLRVVVDWKILQIRSYKFGNSELEQFKTLMLTTPSGSVREVFSMLGDKREVLRIADSY